MTPAFVIVGTGRCGTGYIASVLTACGIPCGHEAWFNPIGNRVRNLIGDSSWCALAALDDFDGQVFHQTRHPLAVVTSLIESQPHSPYGELRDEICQGLPADPVERAMAGYVLLNELAEKHAEIRWQVEQVTAELLVDIAHRVCVPIPWQAAANAIELVPNTTNRHTDRAPLGWNDLPSGGWLSRLTEMAGRYGYQ